MSLQKATGPPVYRPNRFTGPGSQKLRGKRWETVLAVVKEFEAKKAKENAEQKQTEGVSAAQASELNQMESMDVQGSSQQSQGERENATVTRTSAESHQIEQENVGTDAESRQINMEVSGGDSGSEVQFLGESEAQVRQEEQLNISNWTRINDFQRFLDSLPPLPSSGTRNNAPLENLREPVAHCSTSRSPLPNLNPTFSVSVVANHAATPRQVKTVKAVEKNNEKANNNTQLQNRVSDLALQKMMIKSIQEMSKSMQEMCKMMQELRSQGQQMQAILKDGPDEIVRDLKRIIKRLDELNRVRDGENAIERLLQTVITKMDEMKDRMPVVMNQHRDYDQVCHTPATPIRSLQLPKQQGQFKRKPGLNLVPPRNPMKSKDFSPKRMQLSPFPAPVTKKTGVKREEGSRTPKPATGASAIPPPTMSVSSYRVLRSRQVKKVPYVPLSRINKQSVLQMKKSVGK